MYRIFLSVSVFCLGFLTNGVFAQELRNHLGDIYYDTNLYRNKYKVYEGSPYLNEKFTPCKINEISETQLVRFNAYEGNVEVKISTSKVVVLGDSDTYRIVLKDGSGKKYRTANYLNAKEKPKHSFFEIIYEGGPYQLYYLEKIKFTKEVKAEGYKEAQPASFKKAAGSFFVSDLWEKTPYLVELPARLNSFLELFPDQAKALKKFIRENRLKIDNTEDLVKIMNQALVLN